MGRGEERRGGRGREGRRDLREREGRKGTLKSKQMHKGD